VVASASQSSDALDTTAGKHDPNSRVAHSSYRVLVDWEVTDGTRDAAGGKFVARTEALEE